MSKIVNKLSALSGAKDLADLKRRLADPDLLPIILTLVLLVLLTIYLNKGDGYNYDEDNVGSPKGPFSLDEVATHNTDGDIWIIVEEKVYDVTKYLDNHPGGVHALGKYAGRDATKAFRGPQHGSQVDDVIANFYIGDVKK